MTVELRPHHLLCLLTFVGKGYSAAFVHNMEAIVHRLEAGETVRVIEGPDDICRPLLGTGLCHCHNYSVRIRDTRALADIRRLPGFDGKTTALDSLDAERIDTLRSAFAAGTIRSACGACPWDALCSAMAARNYEGARLAGPTAPSSGD